MAKHTLGITQAKIDEAAILAVAQSQWPKLDNGVWWQIATRRLLIRLHNLVLLGRESPR